MRNTPRIRAGGRGARLHRFRLLTSRAVLLPLVGVVLVACDGAPEAGSGTHHPTADPSPVGTGEPPSVSVSAPSAPDVVTFASVVDGDTVHTSLGTVRLIGIDTPERGECGYDEAAILLARTVKPGDAIELESPTGVDDVDRHGRLLRYVTTADGVDLGLAELLAGHAVARYDSADGYPPHPREAEYRAAQSATLAPTGSVIPTMCATSPPAPSAAPTTDDWWTTYSSCTKLKKNAAGHPVGPFDRDDPAEAEIYEWFAFGTGNRGDGDGDGLACE